MNRLPHPILRPMQADDIAACAHLWHEGWHDAHAAICPADLCRLRTLESFAERLEKDLAQARVAVVGDARAGFWIRRADELYQFFVGRRWRGTGLASQMLADAEAQIAACGHRRAWLACTVGNTRAARFYERHGWQRKATETMAFETSEGPFELAAWRYEKAL